MAPSRGGEHEFIGGLPIARPRALGLSKFAPGGGLCRGGALLAALVPASAPGRTRRLRALVARGGRLALPARDQQAAPPENAVREWNPGAGQGGGLV